MDLDILIALCALLLAVGISALVIFLKRKKRMRDLGVSDADRQSFARELDSERARRVGSITITDNWLCHKFLGMALFPLKEVEFFEKGYDAGRYNTTFHVTLLFSDGGKIKLPCLFEQQDELMAVLAERCPQANERPWGTYL
ncbi:MAG: hypothetical protein FWF60_00715 [Oscillospiraceae bacterium]|nr:hypothetical protein [Oscillospiraceae bacterium]